MADIFVADQNKIALLMESGTYATANGTGIWPGLVQSHEVDENMNVIKSRFAGTASRNVAQFIDGPTDFTGTLTVFPQNWRMLWLAMGAVADSGSSSPYIHTITETDSNDIDVYNGGTFPSFTIEDSQSTWVAGSGMNFVRTINGCTADSMTLTASEGEPISFEIGYTAQDVTYSSGATTAITEDTKRPYMSSDVCVYLPSGTKMSHISEFSLTVNNNLEAPHYVDCGNGRTIAQPIPTNRDYEVSITTHGDRTWTKSLYDQYFLGGSTFNMLVTSTISTGSRDLLITCSGCKLTDMSAPTTNEGVNEWSLTIEPEKVSIVANDEVEKYAPW